MVHAKNYETATTFVKVMQKKLWLLFFPTMYRLCTTVCAFSQNNELQK